MPISNRAVTNKQQRVLEIIKWSDQILGMTQIGDARSTGKAVDGVPWPWRQQSASQQTDSSE